MIGLHNSILNNRYLHINTTTSGIYQNGLMHFIDASTPDLNMYYDGQIVKKNNQPVSLIQNGITTQVDMISTIGVFDPPTYKMFNSQHGYLDFSSVSGSNPVMSPVDNNILNIDSLDLKDHIVVNIVCFRYNSQTEDIFASTCIGGYNVKVKDSSNYIRLTGTWTNAVNEFDTTNCSNGDIIIVGAGYGFQGEHTTNIIFKMNNYGTSSVAPSEPAIRDESDWSLQYTLGLQLIGHGIWAVAGGSGLTYEQYFNLCWNSMYHYWDKRVGITQYS